MKKMEDVSTILQVSDADGHPDVTSEAPPTAQIPNDAFDPTRLRLSQDFAADLGVKKALLTVPVRKPDRQSFIRVHPDLGYRLETALLEVKEERETYLVEPSLWQDLSDDIIPKVLFTAVTRQGVVFLLPCRLPGRDGRLDAWNRSLLEAATIARERWVRVVPNMSLGAYEVFEAASNQPEPKWPEVSFHKLLRLAFKDRFIDCLEHPVLRRLRGEL